MEQQIQLRSNHNLSTPLNQKELEIAKVIWHVNQLQPYPLSDNQIEAWSKSINELRPNQDIDVLRAIINMMKFGNCEFNPKLGIQNIFIALKKYDPIAIGYVEWETQGSFSMSDSIREYKTEFERKYYYEGQNFPKNIIWLIDEQQYLKNNLREQNTIPQSIHSEW